MLYKGAPMRDFHSTTLVFLVVFLSSLGLAPGLSAGERVEGDLDRLDRVQELQREAMEASRSGDWPLARELAEIVLTLDDTEVTARSRLILVQALEKEGQYSAAQYELGQFLDLELSRANRRKGEQLKARIEHLRALQSGTVLAPRPRSQPTQAGAVGLLLGGVAMSVAGAYFVGTDISWSTKRVPSGTWAAIGTPLLVGGIGLDIGGVILLHRSVKQRRAADLRRMERTRPRLGLSWDGQRFSVAFGGRW